MHELQKKLLDLAKKQNIEILSLREIASIISSSDKQVHAQSVKHHIRQLVKKGLLIIDKTTKSVIVESAGRQAANFVSIPIVGAANCGEAKIFAEENIEGFLRVSPSLVKSKTIATDT